MKVKTITQLHDISPDELKESIVSELKAEIQHLSEYLRPIDPPQYLTRKELSEVLKVSVVTLIDWDKKGIIKPYRLGNLVRYKRGEIEQALIRKKP